VLQPAQRDALDEREDVALEGGEVDELAVLLFLVAHRAAATVAGAHLARTRMVEPRIRPQRLRKPSRCPPSEQGLHGSWRERSETGCQSLCPISGSEAASGVAGA
jgi:hypothetical protein